MSKEKEKQKRMMHLFYVLFYIFLISGCSLPVIAVINFWTSVNKLAGISWGIVTIFFAFVGIVCSFIFQLLAENYQGLYLYLEDNQTTAPKIRKNKRIIFGCAVALALAGIGTYAGVRTRDYLEIVTFSRERWLSGEWSTRGYMVDSFVKEYHLLTLNKEQVDYYLGAPDVKRDTVYIYYVTDYGPSFSSNPFLFSIQFGSTDLVTRWFCYES